MIGIATQRILALVAVAALTLSACASGTPTSTAPATGPQPAAGGQPAAKTGAPATVAPKGEFRVNLGGEPKTIDPNRANFATEVAVASQLFEGLLTLDKSLSPVPGVAREVPSTANGGISADGLNYTFKLRDDLKWSDGKPLSAKDFEYGLKRTLDPRVGSTYASFFHDIKGAKAFNTALGTAANKIEKSDGELSELRAAVAVRATDDRTVQITLEQPRYTFLQLMALWPAYPIRQDVVEAKGDQWIEAGNLIGNGPFKLAEWEHQVQISMVPNEHYHGQQPRLAKLTYKMFAEPVAAWAAYQNNELDLVNVPAPQYKIVLADPNMRNQIQRNLELVTFALQMSTKVAPFDNPKLRQAFMHAIDRRAFVEQINSGVGRVAESWIPEGMPGHNPDLASSYRFDPAKAKQLLAEAGYPDGRGLPEIRFTYADVGTNKDLAQFVQAQIKANLGVDLKLEPLEAKAYQTAHSSRQLQSWWSGWGADYPDPDNWLPNIFGTGKSSNHTQLSDSQLDDLMTRALTEPDDAKRLALWKEAEKRMLDLAPIVPILQRERLWALKPQFKGFQMTAKDNLPGNRFYSQVYID